MLRQAIECLVITSSVLRTLLNYMCACVCVSIDFHCFTTHSKHFPFTLLVHNSNSTNLNIYCLISFHFPSFRVFAFSKRAHQSLHSHLLSILSVSSYGPLICIHTGVVSLVLPKVHHHPFHPPINFPTQRRTASHGSPWRLEG